MLKILAITFCLFVSASSALALPIGFGFPQGDRVYNQTTNPNFLIYHDASSSHEAMMIMDSLEAARPVLNQWFAISRKRPLNVISSAMTANASFANFFTDAIELQTFGQGQRDLFWHEYVHNMMYLHTTNFLGPAGNIFHLPWMPAWFLEGLAEAITVSVASDRQATIERKQAMWNTWPSFDRLHSLYSTSDFFEQGYATSGAFVAWILRKGHAKQADFLPKLLKKFYRYTLPYYYPLTVTSVVPFINYLPMDQALRDFFGKDGRELYEEYKAEAKQYWTAHQEFKLIDKVPKKTAPNYFSRFPTAQSYLSSTYIFQRQNDNYLSELQVFFDPDSGLVTEQKTGGFRFPSRLFGVSVRGDYPIGIEIYPDIKTGLDLYRIVLLKANKSTYNVDSVLIEREGQISKLAEGTDKIFWNEMNSEVSRICYIDKAELNSQHFPLDPNLVHCPVSETLPKTLEVMGNDLDPLNEKFYARRVWYAIHEQTLHGDRHELWEWQASDNSFTQLHSDPNAQPLSVVKTGSTRWALIAEQKYRTLVKMTPNGECLGMLPLNDDLVSLSSVNEDLILGVALNNGYTLRRLNANKLVLKSCRSAFAHVSPLILAMRNPNLDIGAALENASLWREETVSNTVNKPALGAYPSETLNSENKPAEWHPHPKFILPWIGADDALGYQLGVVTVPLMDDMQNETLYATFLYGLVSRYPNTILSVSSTRYWPQLNLSAFRRQIWDGFIRQPDGEVISSYLDQTGLRFAASINAYFSLMNLTFSTGVLAAQLHPYIGAKVTGSEGVMYQPFASLAFSGNLKQWSWMLGVDGKLAPEQWNERYDFNVLGGRAELKTPLPFLLNSTIGLQLEGSRTRGRGAKTPVLKQYYTALKTFIPGTSGGYVQNSFPMWGNGQLLQVHFGDTMARAELDWSFPLIKDWDKMYWILYFYELRFSSFLNYGGAWNQGQNPKPNLFLADGCSFDLLFENKGVHFNVGLGIGQVRPGAGQAYLNAGFDLMF